MQYRTKKQTGFGNRVHIITHNCIFNNQTIWKGLETDGGSIPKILIIGLFLILNAICNLHWSINIIIFAIAIDESNGWFQKAFFLHDQGCKNANCWKDFWIADWQFFKNMLYKVCSYDGKYFFKVIFHIPLGLLLATIYPLAVAVFGWVTFYFKYARNFNE